MIPLCVVLMNLAQPESAGIMFCFLGLVGLLANETCQNIEFMVDVTGFPSFSIPTGLQVQVDSLLLLSLNPGACRRPMHEKCVNRQ